MANQEQLEILEQGGLAWNRWRQEKTSVKVDLTKARLSGANLGTANLSEAILSGVDFRDANLSSVNFRGSQLDNANFQGSTLYRAIFAQTTLNQADFLNAKIGETVFAFTDLNQALNLDTVKHGLPSSVGEETIVLSKGSIPESFLRGCGLSDWQVESAKLYNPDLINEEIVKVQYRIYDLRATQAIQISPLFISYSHSDSAFVDDLEIHLNKKGIRFWRDTHDSKAGRLEKQIDRAMRLNPIVLLILSENSLKSDWVEHEVRTARTLEKEKGRDVLCPIALDDSWKNSPWSKIVMEQVMEYNILDFSGWKDNRKFKNTFNKLIDGLGLFYE